MIFNNCGLKKVNKFLWILILFTVAFNIIFLMRYNFEADSAFYVLLAQEQIRTGSLFPEGVYYSTGLFILTPNLLVIPFLFLTENLVLARQSAILLLWVFVYIILYKVFNTKKEKDLEGFVIASVLFSVFYVNASVVSMHFYQGAYVGYLLFLFLFLAMMNRIITENNFGKINLAGLLLLYILANLGDIRNLLIWGIPGFIAYFLYNVLKSRWNFSFIRNLLEELKLLEILLLGILLGFIVFKFMARMYGNDGSTSYMVVLAAKDYGKSFFFFFTGLFGLYGNSSESFLFSFNGIMKFINFFVMIMLNFFIPVFAIKNYYKIKQESSRFLIIFSLISTFIYFIVIFLTGGAIVEERYLIHIYNNNIVLFAVIGSHILKNQLKNHLSLGVFCIIFYVLLSNIFYFYNQKDSLLYQKFGAFAEGIEGVTDFLEHRGLKYGYGTFRNAEGYSILSNNKVTIRGILFDQGKLMPFNWLTVNRFYNPNEYIGNSFLMLADDEIKLWFPTGISSMGLGQPVETIKYKKYTIFVYDYNISSKFVKGKKVYWLIRGDKNNSGTYISNE